MGCNGRWKCFLAALVAQMMLPVVHLLSDRQAAAAATCPAIPPVSCAGSRQSGIATSAAVKAQAAPETPEQQAAIIRHLKALATADRATAAAVSAVDAAADAAAAQYSSYKYADVLEYGATSSSSSSSNDGSTAAASIPVRVLPAEPTSTSPNQTLTYIQNDNYKVGVDVNRAGVVAWISSFNAPEPWKDKNLLNTYDLGRLLQQSFYGCPDGSCWATKPWVYNPVQGGSWTNKPSVTTRQVLRNTTILVEGHPRNWAGEELLPEVTYSTYVTLRPDHIYLRFKMRYEGQITHRLSHQEIPAVFLDRGLSVLALYMGDEPWTGDDNVTYVFPGFPNELYRPTETWAAYLDPVTGWGLGLYNPKATTGITSYRVGRDNSTLPSDCSYFALLTTLQLVAGMEDYSYSAIVAVGNITSIRDTFRRIEFNRRRTASAPSDSFKA